MSLINNSGAERDLLRVQASLAARRNGPVRRRDHVVADATPHSHSQPVDDTSTYVCECGLTFRAATSPHAVCPACGREQVW
jgi:rubrerythrin